jgi:hypothetical protein
LEDTAFPEPFPALGDELLRRASEVTHAMSEVLKRREKSPNDASLLLEYERLREDGERIQRELQKLSEQGAAYVKSQFGITEDDLTRIAQANWPVFGSEYSTSEIQGVPSTANLDELVAHGYDALMSVVNREWLDKQSPLRRQWQARHNSSAAFPQFGDRYRRID